MSRVELIAEVSSNHGGDMELAKAFIWAYAEAGADFVKFQSYRVRTLRPGDPQRDWLAQAELSDDAHHILQAECAKAGTQFLTTVFHASRVPFLASLGLPAIKIGSGESDRGDIIKAAMARRLRVLQSLHLVGDRGWADRVEHVPHEILSCVSRYPASRMACLAAIACVGYYRITGYSDHAVGNEMAEWAIENGARIVERHVSLPEQRRAKRHFESTVEEFKQLRAFANNGPGTYQGRWQHGD